MKKGYIFIAFLTISVFLSAMFGAACFSEAESLWSYQYGASKQGRELRRGGKGMGRGKGGISSIRFGAGRGRPLSAVWKRYYGFHTYAYAGAPCLHTDKVCI